VRLTPVLENKRCYNASSFSAASLNIGSNAYV